MARPIQIASLLYLGLFVAWAGAQARPIGEDPPAIEVEVSDKNLDVFDQPDDRGYICGQACHGDRLRLRPDQTVGTGWLAIEAMPTSILWIQKASLGFENETDDRSGPASTGLIKPDQGPLGRAWIKSAGAVIRSGHPQARLPGPQRGRLPGGTQVQLVDRPPLNPEPSRNENSWLAIVPPRELAFFIHAKSIRWPEPHAPPDVAEIRASYEEPKITQADGKASGPTPTLPPEISAELARLDSTFQLIVRSQPVPEWRFEALRAGYQGLLKRAGDRSDVEGALRTRLARVTQHEQAAKAARTIESILATSHRRDDEVAAARRELTQLARTRARAFDAVGFIQPSARMVDGHKVFSLIGREGKTIAYLDIPAGLDPEPFLASRVGVRGRARFSEDLGTRLITVRDLESVEKKQ